MNRIEFMTELAALLQDISVEERREAMQYYNDYFDDAGEKSEEEIITELESPAKVAAEVKAGLKGANEEAGEYRETGYTDTRFEEKESPVRREAQRDYRTEEAPPRTSSGLKILLIVLVVLIGLPVIIPLICVAFALVCAMFCVFFGLVLASAAVIIAGIATFWAGILALVPELAVGFALMGTGLILTVLGTIAIVGSVRLCIIVIPGIVRGIVWMIRRPFQGRKAVA